MFPFVWPELGATFVLDTFSLFGLIMYKHFLSELAPGSGARSAPLPVGAQMKEGQESEGGANRRVTTGDDNDDGDQVRQCGPQQEEI